jgi:hypothetical protein
VFYAFDLLYLDGRNLMDEPLLDRKRALRKLVRKGRRPGRLRYTDQVLTVVKRSFRSWKCVDLREWSQSGLIVVIEGVGPKCG